MYLNTIYAKMAYGMNILNVVKNDNILLYNNKIMKLCSNSVCIPNLKMKYTPVIAIKNECIVKLTNTLPNISKINILTVDDEIEIPNVTIHFIKSNNEFGIRINNQLITGNLMNIVSKKNLGFNHIVKR